MPRLRAAAFAIPGDLNRKTGGYIYERRMLESLRAQGRAVEHIELPATFPEAPPADMAATVRRLCAVPPDVALILDGLVYGGIDTGGLAQVAAPVVAMIHHPVGLEGGLSPQTAAALLRREAANLALAAHVVVPSPHTKRILVADFGVPEEAISIACPGFDRPAPDAPDAPAIPDIPPLILSVGLLATRKGHDVLIDALARLTDLDWQAQIVGGTHEPALAAALPARARAAGLDGRLVFRGTLEAEALAALYRRATVFALATRYEGYGMVFGEALLHGLPIVTCAAGAVPETVPPGCGHLVPVDDPAAFADALRHLLTDATARHAMAAAAAGAGRALPEWDAAAAVMGGVLDAMP